MLQDFNVLLLLQRNILLSPEIEKHIRTSSFKNLVFDVFLVVINRQRVAVSCLTVQVFSVADVLEVAARVLPAQLRLWPVGFEPGVIIPPVFGAGGHAAGGRIPHGGSWSWL